MRRTLVDPVAGRNVLGWLDVAATVEIGNGNDGPSDELNRQGTVTPSEGTILEDEATG